MGIQYNAEATRCAVQGYIKVTKSQFTEQ